MEHLSTFPLYYGSACRDFGYALAFHCAPTIQGIKPANLVSLQKERYGDFNGIFHQYATLMHKKGVYFYKLAESPQRILLLVYNRKRLSFHLKKPDNKSFLEGFGYEAEQLPLHALLKRLRSRVACGNQQSYPHEIGVFLGYPLDDVKGFIQNGGDAYELCGYWKVYHNPKRAKALFRAYDRLRCYYCAQLSQGETIHTIHLGGNIYEQNTSDLLVGNG